MREVLYSLDKQRRSRIFFSFFNYQEYEREVLCSLDKKLRVCSYPEAEHGSMKKVAYQDFLQIQDCTIKRNTILVLYLMLHGGAPLPKIPNRTNVSFKDVVKGKSSIPIEQLQNISKLYIIEQLEEVPAIEEN